jgi:hypothetical protein
VARVRTTVYVEITDKERLEEISRRTGVPEARLWRQALKMLLEAPGESQDGDRDDALAELRRITRRLEISRAYRAYKMEERRLEGQRAR